jgi:hypothetical protein
MAAAGPLLPADRAAPPVVISARFLSEDERVLIGDGTGCWPVGALRRRPVGRSAATSTGLGRGRRASATARGSLPWRRRFLARPSATSCQRPPLQGLLHSFASRLDTLALVAPALNSSRLLGRPSGRLVGSAPEGHGRAIRFSTGWLVVRLAQMVAAMPSMGWRPVADQHGPDVAVVQDDGAAAAVYGEPECPSMVPVEALRAGLGGCARSVLAGVREGRVGTAGCSPAVVGHPVRDRVAILGWLVVRPVESPPHFVGEPLLLVGVAGGEAAPGRRRDQLREVDRFRVDGGEEPGGAERVGLAGDRDQRLAAMCPSARCCRPVLESVSPDVAADQEAGQHGIEGDRGAVAPQQPGVSALRGGDVREVRVVERGGGLAGVRRADPVSVPGADVAVLR